MHLYLFSSENALKVQQGMGRGVFKRDTRFYSLFVPGCFFGNAKQTNYVFFCNIWCFVITNPSFIWFGSTSVDICTALVNSWLRKSRLYFLCLWKSLILKQVLEVSTKNKYTGQKIFEKFLSKHEKHRFWTNNEQNM